MVEISSPSSSFNTLNTPRSRTETSTKKPAWLIAIYALFALVCLNAARTYQNQKRFVRLQIEELEHNDSLEIHHNSAASAEEQHVVSANYGSSMYGGAIHAASSSSTKKKKKNPARATTLDNIRPKPSDGSKDYNIIKKAGSNHSSSDFNGFSFYVMTDTPVRKKQATHNNAKSLHLRLASNDAFFCLILMRSFSFIMLLISFGLVSINYLIIKNNIYIIPFPLFCRDKTLLWLCRLNSTLIGRKRDFELKWQI